MRNVREGDLMFGLNKRALPVHSEALTTGTHVTPAVGSHEAVASGAGVYLDLVAGLKKHVIDLQRDKRLWQAAALLALMAIAMMLPLRKREPYFLEVNSVTGSVAMSNRVVQELKVSDQNIAFFLRIWTARMVTINGTTLREGLPSAMRWARGAAANELDTWSEKDDRTVERITKTPGLTREILGVPNVSFNEDRNLAFIDFVWLEKINGIERERKRKLLTLEFGLVPPKSAESDPDNPLGMAISHFTIQDQTSK
jgi:VirB8 protein